MNLSGKSIKHIILGLGMCSSLALVAPVSATQAASAHYDYPLVLWVQCAAGPTAVSHSTPLL
jgi:hypothetical protein